MRQNRGHPASTETTVPNQRERLLRLNAAAIRRGIEKEGLRVEADGRLARDPHPRALGSALTHPHITTDFSEAQLELVTGVHADISDCMRELTDIHREVLQAMDTQRMWVSSMPGLLPPDADIPIGDYGSSNVGRAKRVYRNGLVHRYGARMQTISGIHHNWSISGASTEDYFALIRNFRRHVFVLLMLFGASPAVTRSFVSGLDHGLQPLGADTLHLPHATSLRMGRLGYQSDAQSALCVSYNHLEGYAHSLHGALVGSHPPYEALGIQASDGSYRQLGTSLLQIENEFYSPIRPKRVTRAGERPLHALRERGVEYVEVRCMDLQPELTVGIDEHTMRVLDVFLVWAMTADSPPDSPQEIRDLADNQRLVAARGREPGLRLRRAGEAVLLSDWAAEVMREALPVAHHLDELHGTEVHTQAWRKATHDLAQTDQLPSARVLQGMLRDHAGEHVAYGLAASGRVRDALLAQPLGSAEADAARQRAERSWQAQADLEAADQGPGGLTFEAYRLQFLDPARLVV